MERHFYEVALAVGVIGLLFGLVLMPRQKRVTGLSRGAWLFAALLPLIVFILTWPTHAPYANGHGFGLGFLMGGLGALLAGFLALHSAPHEGESSGVTASAIALTTPQSVALLALTAPLLWLRHDLLDTLPGIAIGWFAVTMLLLVGLQKARTENRRAVLPLVAGIGFTITLCCVFILGELHARTWPAGAKQSMSWSAIGALVAASVPFFTLVCSLPNHLFAAIAMKMPLANLFAGASGRVFHGEEARASIARGLRLLFGMGLLLGAARWMNRLSSIHGVTFRLVAAGLAAGLIVLWAAAERARRSEENPAISQQYGALLLLTFAAATMLAYQWLQGVGMGILLLAAWFPLGLAFAARLESSDDASVSPSSDLLRLLLFGSVLLLYRVVSARFSAELSGVGLTDQYALFGLLVGAFAPALLSGYVLRGETRFLRFIVAGGLALFLPGVTLLLYGAKCGLALLMGAALSFVTNPPTREPDSPHSSAGKGETETTALAPPLSLRRRGAGGEVIGGLGSALFAVAIALTLSQWTGRVLTYTLLSRHQRLHILEWCVGILVVALLAADFGGRLRRRTQEVTV